ncbi:MAG: serpin family protein, partial [Synergistaceae bacterium]|nr:serpin family protein [Synergistaceae bacterium]
WTYHSLEALSNKDLIKEKIIPGESSYTKEQAAAMIIEAIKKIITDPSKMGDDQLCSMRQLINGYRNELEAKGQNFDKIRTELEDMALAAGLTAIEISDTSSSKERPLNFQAVRSVNKFTFDIYRYFAAKNTNGLFISPYSVSSALSMTYAGAEGKTAREMESVLHLTPEIHRSMSALINDINSVPDDTATVKTANAIWPAKDENLLDNYTEKIRCFYEASLTPLNYREKSKEARTTINNWVDKETEGKIKNLIGEGVLKKGTTLVLTNAVYFKSDWMNKFDPQNSRAVPFHISPTESVPTVMMTKTDKKVRYSKESDLEIVDIPYTNNRFSMLILLPQKGTKLEKIEQKLNHLNFVEWTAFLTSQKVRLTIPKFKTEQSFELSEALKGMGMASAFNAGKADFSGMNGKKNLYIGAAIHKTFLEVGEEGTEAAAATAVIMTKTSIMHDPEETIEFKADRPFIYMIKDNQTGAILFIGRYTKP